jgi:hypothetical protein
MVTFFSCSGDFELAWIASLCAQGDREQEEMERQEDLDREEELALEHAYDEEPGEWAWYADAPTDVEPGEVIEDADLLGLPVEQADSTDPDDEVALDAQEGEDE